MPGALGSCSMPTSCALHGQNRSPVKTPSSIWVGRPSQTSVVTSDHASVAGSMCQLHGAFVPGSSRTISPDGMVADESPVASA